MVKVKVIYDYDAAQPDELTIKNGDIISEVKKQPGGWWEGTLNGKRGVFPDNFVEDFVVQNEPPKGPKPTGGKISEVQKKIADHIKLGPPPLKGPKASKQMAVVLFEYKPEQPDELELMEGDEVEVIRMAEEGWWEGVLKGKTGMFPSNFVKLIETPAPPLPGSHGYAPSARQNDIGAGIRAAAPPGGRPPAEKPKMPPPATSVESANPPLLPKRGHGFSGVRARVVYSYHAQNDDELSLSEGQILTVLEQRLEDAGWWKGELNGRTGVFPDNFVEIIREEEAQPQPTRINRPPPQLPQEPDQPAKLPPRPKQQQQQQPQLPQPDISNQEPERGATPPMSKHKTERELPKPQQQPMVNGDDKALMALREEIEKMKSSMVSRESYEILQRELRATKDSFDSYKKENNKKIIDLMKEIDDCRKQGTQNTIELARIRKLAEDEWMSK